MRVALITSRQHPELIVEDRPLVPALARLGADAVPVVWDDDVDWSRFTAALVRTPWDYTYRREEFLDWAERAGRLTRLFNSARVLRWSSHKQYLLDLAARGVPVVPTAMVRSDEPFDLATIGAARGWDEVVVKPCVSAGARDTVRVRAATGQGVAEPVRARGDILIQPYEPEVERSGERSLVFIGGELSHAARKHPMLVATADGRDPLPAEAALDELALARLVLARAPEALLYARVDLVRDAAGQPRLMELEALEPRLFFQLHPPAADRLAVKLLHRLA